MRPGKPIGDRDPVQQQGPAVLVQGEDELRLLYFSLNAGVRAMRRDGLSAAHLEQLKVVVRRALMAACGHEHPVYVLAEEDSTRQELWSIARAADELEVSTRQMRRIARKHLGEKEDCRDWQLPKAAVLAWKQERDWRARNGSRSMPRAA